jgi:hypothetical protein
MVKLQARLFVWRFTIFVPRLFIMTFCFRFKFDEKLTNLVTEEGY